MTYFRITAYHPQKDICAIFDSHGRYEKLWQFSADLVAQGFKIFEVGSDEKFAAGTLETLPPDREHILLRACNTGKPTREGKVISVADATYLTV